MIFFDMDGTIAKFYHDKKCLEKMYEKGYFLSLKPYALAKYVNELAAACPSKVGILTACIDSPTCEQEKRAWLNIHCPNVLPENRIFIMQGESKAEAVKEWDKNHNPMILVDDYSKNIYDWQMCGDNYIAIKYFNGMNNKTNKHYHYAFRSVKQLDNWLLKLGY